jgi:hypothetical protein
MHLSMRSIFSEPTARGWTFVGALFCTLMLVIHIDGGLHCAGLLDFWRDMYWAAAIAHGEKFPLPGPPINRLAELGPWWFYLLAIPIWLTERIALASVFLQVLASLKYFLAWRIGTRAVDARFGLTFAIGVAIAGWSTSSFWFPSHPALVETCLLLLAMAVWRCWDRFTIGNAALYGLASAACLHAHPTTVLYLFAGGIALLYRYRSMRAFWLVCLGAFIVALSLLPPWLDTEAVVAGGRNPIDTYLQQDVAVNLLTRIPLLIKGLLVGGAWSGFLLMTPWKAESARIAWYVFCACLLVAATGVAILEPRHRSLRRWFVGAIACFVVQCAFMAAVRAGTSIWMAPSCLPPLSLAIAIGWYGWVSSDSRARRIAGSFFLAIYTALVLAPYGLFLRDLHSARVMPHVNPLVDVSASEEMFTTLPVPFVTANTLDQVAHELCEPVTLHLRLGAAMENSFGVPIRNACGHWTDLHFSGKQPGAHLAGIPVDATTAIGIAPDRVVAGMALYANVRPILPEQGTKPTPLLRMQVKPLVFTKNPEPVNVEFDAKPNEVVALTNRFGLVGPLIIHEVIANDEPARQLYTDGKSFVYRCANCVSDAPVHWQMKLDAIADNLDLIVFAAR